MSLQPGSHILWRAASRPFRASLPDRRDEQVRNIADIATEDYYSAGRSCASVKDRRGPLCHTIRQVKTGRKMMDDPLLGSCRAKIEGEVKTKCYRPEQE